jgi:hypothetical protein
MIQNTATKHAPCLVCLRDNKWFTRGRDRSFRDIEALNNSSPYSQTWTKQKRRSLRPSETSSPRRIRRASRRQGQGPANLERATHPLSRLGDPLHHRTNRSSQQECQTSRFCRELKSLLRKRLEIEAVTRLPVIFSNINTYGEFIWNRGWLAVPPLISNRDSGEARRPARQRYPVLPLACFPAR